VTAIYPPWGPNDRRLVAQLIRDGRSLRAIGQIFKMSGNAACGRVYRDDELHKILVSREKKTPTPKHRPVKAAPSAPRVPPMARARTSMPSIPRPVRKASPPPPLSAPVPNPVALMDTGISRCKWPIGYDVAVIGGFVCCGAGVRLGDHYCPYHKDLAMAPSERSNESRRRGGLITDWRH
jgi:hypothetical protein